MTTTTATRHTHAPPRGRAAAPGESALGRPRDRVRSVVPPVMAAAISTRRRHVPPQMLWHDRMVTASGRYVRLTIPLLGRPDGDLAARATRQLAALWEGQLTASGSTVTSVSADVARREDRTLLTIFLSLDREPHRCRIDDARMARQLRGALALAADGGSA